MSNLTEHERLMMSVVCHIGWNHRIKVKDSSSTFATRFWGTASPPQSGLKKVEGVLDTLAQLGFVTTEGGFLKLTRNGERLWMVGYGHRK